MKKNLTKVMAMAMVMTIAGGATAFAAEPMLISAPVNTAAEAVKEASHIVQTGKVVSVGDSVTEGVSIVEIDNEQGGLRFAVSASTIVVDRKDGRYLQASDLEEGMEVAVIYNVNSPMGMSMPPYLGQVTAVVANADAGQFVVGNFNDELTDMKHMLKLNIGENTNIQNLKGTRIRLTEEDIMRQDALVFYDITTRSIPAQTTPSFVLLLTEAEPVKEGAREEAATATKAVAVPLRETAEAKGYKVVWQGKNQPVKVEKENTSMEIKLGENTYVVEDDMVMTASIMAHLEGGVMYVSSELFQ